IVSGPALKALAPLCKDKDAHLRETVVICIGNNMLSSMPEALPILEAALKDEAPEVRAAAAQSLANAPPDSERAVRALIRTLEDADDGVRCAAARGLMSHNRKAVLAIPALTKHLHDESEDVCKAVAEAIKWIKSDLGSSRDKK